MCPHHPSLEGWVGSIPGNIIAHQYSDEQLYVVFKQQSVLIR
jgi:hypothetical protein